jgi:threonine dehydratase
VNHPISQQDLLDAHERIKPFINRTPVMSSSTFNSIAGASLFFKCENFQKAGAFKFRGATNALLKLNADDAKNGVATHSSGNHAAALSLAARMMGITAHIVMPSNSSKVKIAAVESYGGIITFCEPTLAAREETLKKILAETGAFEIHPYNHLNIICGQATAALELIQEVPDLDCIIAPVGGGGLLSGTALGSYFFSSSSKVYGGEPEMANDAFLSIKNGRLIPSVNPDTIADGLRTSLGSHTYPIIRDHVTEILLAGESEIISTMRLVWERMKIIIEPSSAVPLAALLHQREKFRSKRVGIIFSGGNVDLSDLPF